MRLRGQAMISMMSISTIRSLPWKKSYRFVNSPLLACFASLTNLATSAAATHSSSSAAAAAASASAAATQRMQDESEAETAKLIKHYQDMTNKLSSLPDNDAAVAAAVPVVWTSKEQASRFVREKIDAVLFDCDGVIYRSPHPAPGARECIENLLSQGKRVFFVTNNAGSSRSQLKQKIESILQIEDPALLTEKMMVGSGFAAAQYLKQNVLDKQKGSGRVYVIGSAGLCHELSQTGFTVLHGYDDKPSMTRDELEAYEFPEHPIDAVVVGHDVDLNFRKLCIANVLLQRNPGAPLIATNLDSFDLVGVDSRHIPGNGGAVKFLEHTSRRRAINCGKPSELLANLLHGLYGLDTSRSLFVGDRLDTDIRFGVDTGMYSALVMTGVTTAQQLVNLGEGTKEEPLPSFIVPHIGYMA